MADPPVSPAALADQTGSTYHLLEAANGLSACPPVVELVLVEEDELELLLVDELLELLEDEELVLDEDELELLDDELVAPELEEELLLDDELELAVVELELPLIVPA